MYKRLTNKLVSPEQTSTVLISSTFTTTLIWKLIRSWTSSCLQCRSLVFFYAMNTDSIGFVLFILCWFHGTHRRAKVYYCDIYHLAKLWRFPEDLVCFLNLARNLPRIFEGNDNSWSKWIFKIVIAAPSVRFFTLKLSQWSMRWLVSLYHSNNFHRFSSKSQKVFKLVLFTRQLNFLAYTVKWINVEHFSVI